MRLIISVFVTILGFSLATEARIVRVEISKVEPAFNGQSFGGAGSYERLTGVAHGELDPKSPRNKIIQDIDLAPRNARGMVEYTTQVELLKPVDQTRGNGVLLFEVVNRGRKLALSFFNAGVHGRARAMERTDQPRRRVFVSRRLYLDLVRLAAGSHRWRWPLADVSDCRTQFKRYTDYRARAE